MDDIANEWRNANKYSFDNNCGWVYLGRNTGLKSKLVREHGVKIGKTTGISNNRKNNTSGGEYEIFFAVLVRDCNLIESILHLMLSDFSFQTLKTNDSFFAEYLKSSVLKDVENFQGDEWFCYDWKTLILFLLSRAYLVQIYDKETAKEINDFIETVPFNSLKMLYKSEDKITMFDHLGETLKRYGFGFGKNFTELEKLKYKKIYGAQETHVHCDNDANQIDRRKIPDWYKWFKTNNYFNNKKLFYCLNKNLYCYVVDDGNEKFHFNFDGNNYNYGIQVIIKMNEKSITKSKSTSFAFSNWLIPDNEVKRLYDIFLKNPIYKK